MGKSVLDEINSPQELRKLAPEDLPQLCNELRQFIIDELSKNPGHFGSSLGAVDLTVALHYVYNTPYDRLVWDVGHQAYAHKILTLRKDRFHTNRQYGGLCGFPSRDESEYDAFVGGHASVSISAALGMAVASKLNNDAPERRTIAVIGDGSLTGGLAFEGLNNASSQPNNLLVILNDNNMAIDESVGGLSQYLMSVSISPFYNKIRNKIYHFAVHRGWVHPKRSGAYTRLTNSIKALVSRQNSFFEGLNIRYFGPVDGHDVLELVRVLTQMREINGPKLLHVKTCKGKGFAPAEKSATEWHAPGKFDKTTGIRQTPQDNLPPLFQDVFGETIVELATNNPRIVGITPAMPTGCSLNKLAEVMPERMFDVGIAEAHAVTFSAGLATEGMIPFCNIYSSFMQRAYDQVIHDVALQRLPVVLCLDRAGLVGEDGATHHGSFDLAFMRCVPNIIVSAPMDEITLRNLMYTAQAQTQAPFVIRYPRGRGVTLQWRLPLALQPIGQGRILKNGNGSIAILSLGAIGNEVTKALELLGSQASEVAHFDMIYLKPLDETLLLNQAKQYHTWITIEDGVREGGFGTAIAELIADKSLPNHLIRLGLPDRFVKHGTQAQLHQECAIDAQSIALTIKQLL